MRENTVKVNVDASGASRGALLFNRSVGSMMNSASGLGSRLMTTATSLKLLAGAAAVAGATIAKHSLKEFISFETEMLRVNSVVGGTKQTLQELSDIASDVGATTNYSAQQAAQGMYNLASAGLSVSEQATTIKDTLYFAGAAAIALEKSTDIVTSTMKQFNIEAGNVSRITNTLAASISTSRASADRLQESLRYVGPVAGTMNVELEETVAVLAQLFNAGLEGSQAGTTLRNAILRLTAPTGEAKSVLGDLGLTLEDIDIKSIGLIKVFEKLRKAQLSEAQAAKLFGQEGINIIRIIRQGRDALEEYRKKITDTNKSQDMYKQITDGTKGSIDELKSAIQALAISIGKDLNPVYKESVSFLTKMTRSVNNIYDSVKKIPHIFNIADNYIGEKMRSKALEDLEFADEYLQKSQRNYAEALVQIQEQRSLITDKFGIPQQMRQGVDIETINKRINELEYAKKRYDNILQLAKDSPDSLVLTNIETKQITKKTKEIDESIERLKNSVKDLKKTNDSFVYEAGSISRINNTEFQLNQMKNIFGGGQPFELDLEFVAIPEIEIKEPEDFAEKYKKELQNMLEGKKGFEIDLNFDTELISEDPFKGLKEKQKEVDEDFKNSFDDRKYMIQGFAQDFTSTLSTMLRTGENMWDDFFDSVMDRMAQLALQKYITQPLFEGLGLVSPSKPDGKASGGPVYGNTPYIVGEKGPELFVPGVSGNIVPNNKLSGAGGNSVQVNIINNAGVEVEQSKRSSGGTDIVDVIISTTKKGFQQGKFDREMSRYGARPQPGF